MTKSYLERTLKFHELYEKEIVPIFRAYEVYRTRAVKKYKLCRFLTWFPIVASCIYLVAINFCPWLEFISRKYPDNHDLHTFLFAVAMISLPVLLVVDAIIIFLSHKYINETRKGFGMTLKTDCLPKILNVFDNIKWKNSENIISDEELEKSGLFANFNKRETDDEFYGEYNGVPFKICETKLIYDSGSGKNRTVISCFKGVIISFRANKTIKNRTMVCTKGDLTKKNNYIIFLALIIQPLCGMFIGCWESISDYLIMAILILIYFLLWNSRQKSDEKLEEVKLEDPSFCKKFNAYSSDQVEARYLLTTSFLERFQKLNTAFGTKRSKCSFCGDNIMFAISTNKNLFEIGDIKISLEDPRAINEFYNQLSSILKMIDYFKLDENTKL